MYDHLEGTELMPCLLREIWRTYEVKVRLIGTSVYSVFLRILAYGSMDKRTRTLSSVQSTEVEQCSRRKWRVIQLPARRGYLQIGRYRQGQTDDSYALFRWIIESIRNFGSN